MRKTKRKAVPAGAVELRGRIEEWRRTREMRGPMPEGLWASAVLLAGEHGVYRIAKAVGVNYESLRDRLERDGTLPGSALESSGGFVELPSAPLASIGSERSSAVPIESGAAGCAARLTGGSGQQGAMVELTAADGARLTVRLQACGAMDLMSLAKDFWGRNR